MIITIDGPIATGKSTIAKKVANELGFVFFDTGAMYRCLTYMIMKNNVDLKDPKALSHCLDTFDYEIKRFRGDRQYFVCSEEVTNAIRSPAITKRVSEVAAIPEVRSRLIDLQRSFAEGINAVFEGRDMGTTIFPDADLKIYLTGNDDVRAKRRFDELRAKFPDETKDLTLEEMKQDIAKRDHYDMNREVSPLKKADDAVIIDTSDLSIDDVVLKVLEHVEV